jgi:hypothetical protein
MGISGSGALWGRCLGIGRSSPANPREIRGPEWGQSHARTVPGGSGTGESAPLASPGRARQGGGFRGAWRFRIQGGKNVLHFRAVRKCETGIKINKLSPCRRPAPWGRGDGAARDVGQGRGAFAASRKGGGRSSNRSAGPSVASHGCGGRGTGCLDGWFFRTAVAPSTGNSAQGGRRLDPQQRNGRRIAAGEVGSLSGQAVFRRSGQASQWRGAYGTQPRRKTGPDPVARMGQWCPEAARMAGNPHRGARERMPMARVSAIFMSRENG